MIHYTCNDLNCNMIPVYICAFLEGKQKIVQLLSFSSLERKEELVWLYSSGVSNPEKGKEPPGPRPLPILGNLLMLDLKKPYDSLCEVSTNVTMV